MRDPLHPQSIAERLKALTNAVQEPLLEVRPLTKQVRLRADARVSRGMFRPDPLVPEGFLAHPTTLRALRTELFVVGEEGHEDLEQWTECLSCHRSWDRQFWLFCPVCESSFGN